MHAKRRYTSYVNEDGLLTVDYEIMGERLVQSTLTGSPVMLSGEVSAMGGIVFDLKFTSATECFMDVTSKAAQSMNKMFDKTGTYTVVDGQIQITIGDKTFTSTFDETTGTYTLVYELQGQDGVFTPELTFSIWE